MGQLLLPRRFRAQPQYPAQIDYAGLGKGAVLLVHPGVGLYDLAAKKVWTPSGTVAIQAAPQGRVLRIDGTDTAYVSLSSPDMSNPAGTFAVFAARIGPTDTFGHVYLSTSTGTNKYYHVAGEDRIDWGVGGGSTSISLSGKIFNTTNTSLVFATNGTGGAGKVFYLNGVAQGTPDASAPPAFSAGANSLVLGKYFGGTSWNTDADILVAAYLQGVFWGSVEAKAFHQNPFSIFKAPSRTLWPASPGGVVTVTGSAACTNADDMASASGTTTVTGAAPATNADDTLSASGSPVVSGNVAVSNADDAASASGSIGSAVSGSASYANADDTASATGTTTVSGSVSFLNAEDQAAIAGTTTVAGSSATVNADDTASASGAIGSAVSGTVAYANIDDSAVASGTTTVTGQAVVANTGDSVAASGSGVIAGTVSFLNADDSAAATGTVIVAGSVAVENADDTATAEGVVEIPEEVIGIASITNANDALSAFGTTPILGDAILLNRNDILVSFGIVNNGAVLETALTSVSQAGRIKKPGIPNDAPPWLRTTLEILTGRRGNRIEVPKARNLTFSSTPTKEECEALFSHISEVRDSLEQLINRQDS